MNAVLSTSTSSQSSSLRPLLLNTAVPPHPPRHTPLPTALHLASSPALLLVRQIVCVNQLNRYESMHCICETPFPLFNYELLPSSNCATALMFELFIHRSDWHSNKPLTIHDSVATSTVVFYGQQKCGWLTQSDFPFDWNAAFRSERRKWESDRILCKTPKAQGSWLLKVSWLHKESCLRRHKVSSLRPGCTVGSRYQFVYKLIY